MVSQTVLEIRALGGEEFKRELERWLRDEQQQGDLMVAEVFRCWSVSFNSFDWNTLSFDSRSLQLKKLWVYYMCPLPMSVHENELLLRLQKYMSYFASKVELCRILSLWTTHRLIASITPWILDLDVGFSCGCPHLLTQWMQSANWPKALPPHNQSLIVGKETSRLEILGCNVP